MAAPNYEEAGWWMSNYATGGKSGTWVVPSYELAMDRATNKFVPRSCNIKDLQDTATADVFWVHPTLELFPEDMVSNKDSRYRDKDGLSFAMSQASCLNSIARIYAPFYRAATFVAEDKQAAWRLAYQDVRQAFSCYLEKWNDGRPFFLCGHSQGSVMLRFLLNDMFNLEKNSGATELRARLVGAYLPGIALTTIDGCRIPLSSGPGQVGTAAVWMTSTDDATMKDTLIGRAYPMLAGTFVCSPISWQHIGREGIDVLLSARGDEGDSDAPVEMFGTPHMGILGVDMKGNPVVYKNILEGVRVEGGLVRIMGSDRGEKLLNYFRKGKDYHASDVHLFWVNIRENARLQLVAWSAARSSAGAAPEPAEPEQHA